MFHVLQAAIADLAEGYRQAVGLVGLLQLQEDDAGLSRQVAAPVGVRVFLVGAAEEVPEAECGFRASEVDCYVAGFVGGRGCGGFFIMPV